MFLASASEPLPSLLSPVKGKALFVGTKVRFPHDVLFFFYMRAMK